MVGAQKMMPKLAMSRLNLTAPRYHTHLRARVCVCVFAHMCVCGGGRVCADWLVCACVRCAVERVRVRVGGGERGWYRRQEAARHAWWRRRGRSWRCKRLATPHPCRPRPGPNSPPPRPTCCPWPAPGPPLCPNPLVAHGLPQQQPRRGRRLWLRLVSPPRPRPGRHDQRDGVAAGRGPAAGRPRPGLAAVAVQRNPGGGCGGVRVGACSAAKGAKRGQAAGEGGMMAIAWRQEERRAGAVACVVREVREDGHYNKGHWHWRAQAGGPPPSPTPKTCFSALRSTPAAPHPSPPRPHLSAPGRRPLPRLPFFCPPPPPSTPPMHERPALHGSEELALLGAGRQQAVHDAWWWWGQGQAGGTWRLVGPGPGGMGGDGWARPRHSGR